MIQNISVIGAGTMGHGIANTFAMHGYKVDMYESCDNTRNTVMEQIHGELVFMADESYIQHEVIDKVLSNITLYSDLDRAVENADFVIEAIPENLDLKKSLFARLDIICPEHTIFASNTSSLSLKEIIEDLPEKRKARTMICHWYNPAHLIPIAELSYFGNMEDAVFKEVYDLHLKAGKQPIKVLKDIPGLIANRMLHAMAREVFHLIEIGAASQDDIDKALKFGPGFRSATTGILETADMGGLDVWCACEDNLFGELNNSTQACDFLRAKVEQGKLGLKSGEGFYIYPVETHEATKNAFNKRLLAQLQVNKNINK